MSEFHPNRTKQVRTRPKLTARRVFECWPILVWAFFLFIAWRLYSGGVHFTRMNGAVDVYQENITPVDEGRLLKLHVTRGQRVAPGTLLAEMDNAPFRIELESLKRDVVADRIGEIRDISSDILKLESELREVTSNEYEDQAIITDYTKYIEAEAAAAQRRPADMRFENESVQRARLELTKAKGRMAASTAHKGKITESLTRLQTEQKLLETQRDAVNAFDTSKVESEPAKITAHLAGIAPNLRADEYQEFVETYNKIAQCRLITDRGGIVDRIDKEVGEFVEIGEGVLKIVGDPEHIVCFLPQDQIGDLKRGDKVWIVSTSDKSSRFVSEVMEVAPRINNVADSTSPLPNRRVHGRDVLVKYPPEARVGDGTFKLLPGQTVIIHTEEPGAVPFLDTLFHNDDNDKVR